MKNDPVYIVSSFWRSGSSMMMRCLDVSGIPCVYDKLWDSKLSVTSGAPDYRTNPDSYYYTGEGDFQCDWPTFYEEHAGKALKVPRASLRLLAPGKYKVIFMTRNPAEVLASMRRFAPFRSWGRAERNTHLYDLVKGATLADLRGRPDIEVLEIAYEDVIADPRRELEKVAAFGVPIDLEKAVAVVDAQHHRNRAPRKYEIRDAGAKGRGVFALQPYKKGEVVAEYDGLTYDIGPELEQDVVDHAISYAPGKVRDSWSIARVLNHSCEPNCGVQNLFQLVAMRDIEAGEELCWDYAMSQDDGWSFECACGTPACRGRVGQYSKLPEDRRAAYDGFISAWLLDKK